MTQSQRFVGKDLEVDFVYSGGTIALNGDISAMDVTMVTGAADATAGNDTNRYRIPTVQDNNANLTAFSIGEDGTATMGVLPVGTEGTLVYYPKGNTAGLPKGGFPAFISTANESYPFEGAVTRQVSFIGQGGTYGTNVFDPAFHVAA